MLVLNGDIQNNLHQKSCSCSCKLRCQTRAAAGKCPLRPGQCVTSMDLNSFGDDGLSLLVLKRRSLLEFKVVLKQLRQFSSIPHFVEVNVCRHPVLPGCLETSLLAPGNFGFGFPSELSSLSQPSHVPHHSFSITHTLNTHP